MEQWIERWVCRNGPNTLQTADDWDLVELEVQGEAIAGDPATGTQGEDEDEDEDEDWELESLETDSIAE